MKLIDAYKKTQDIAAHTGEMPHKVWTTFYEKRMNIEILGDQFNLGSDYKNLDEVRESLEWLVDQFGGKVKWK